MPRTRTTAIPPADPSATHENGDTTTMSPPQDDDRDQLWRRQLGDLASLDEWGRNELTWYVYRLDNDGRKIPTRTAGIPAYVYKFTGAFDLEEVRERVGGGLFLVMGNDSEGVVRERRNISIEGAPRFVGSPAAATVAAAPAPFELVVMQSLAETNRAIGELARTIAQRPAAPETSTDQVVKIFELAASHVRTAPANNGSSSFKDALELAWALEDRARERATDGDSDSLVGLLRETIPRAIEAWESSQAPRTVREIPSAGAGDAPSPGAAAGENGGQAEREIGGVQVLAIILARAVANRTTPDELVRIARTMLTPDELQTLGGLNDMSSRIVISKLARLSPALRDETGQQYVGNVLELLRATAPPETES